MKHWLYLSDKKIKDSFLEVRNHWEKNPSDKQNVGYEEAKKIGILVADYSTHLSSQVGELLKSLKADAKSVQMIFFRDYSLFETMPPEPIAGEQPSLFTYADFSFSGRVKDAAARAFQAEEFDFLFCILPLYRPALFRYIKYAKARCRVGFYDPSYQNVLEMMVKTDLKNPNALRELYHYAKCLRRQSKADISL